MDSNEDASAPGWDAIDRALWPLYSGTKPHHYGTLISYRLGGPDPLDGISVYARTSPESYWHFVTYGFTQLYEAPSDGDGNGFGFELTFRLRRENGEDTPPMWALNFLQNLARYVFQSGHGFSAGHHIDCRGPICLERKTSLSAVLFVKDCELEGIEAPHGRADFLQVIGITHDEMTALQSWNSIRFAHMLKSHLPALWTDLGRTSLMANRDFAEAVAKGAAADGSSTGFLAVANLDWGASRSLLGRQKVQLTLGAGAVEAVVAVLKGRLPFGRTLELSGNSKIVRLRPSNQCVAKLENTVLDLELTLDATREITASLRPKAGVVKLESYPALQITIEPTQIKDPQGNVVSTVG